jgi:hypothetical protein
MEPRPPDPMCKALLVCRQVVKDAFTDEYILIGPTHQVTPLTYPAVVTLGIFAHWTSVQGTYKIELQLRDVEGRVVWQEDEPPLAGEDPLLAYAIAFAGRNFILPKPGTYDLVMLANGEEVGRNVLFANVYQHPTY